MVVWTGTPWSDAMASLCACVLREQGMCVLHAGALDDLGGFCRFVERQGPHRIVGVTGPALEREDATGVALRVQEALGEVGAHLDWVAPGLSVPMPGVTAFPRLTTLGEAAAVWVRTPEAS